MVQPIVSIVWNMFPLDLMVPLIFKIPLNYICILIYVPMLIPFQIWNFPGNTISILLWCMLGLFIIALICLEAFFVFLWIDIIVKYFWCFPDIWVIWTIITITAIVIGLFGELTGGTYDIEKPGPKAWIIDIMEDIEKEKEEKGGEPVANETKK